MNTTRMYFESHPILGFIVSSVLVFSGFAFGGDVKILAQIHQSDPGLPMWVKDVFQCLAWSGAGITGFVAGHGWWVKNITPFIERRKNSKKHKSK